MRRAGAYGGYGLGDGYGRRSPRMGPALSNRGILVRVHRVFAMPAWQIAMLRWGFTRLRPHRVPPLHERAPSSGLIPLSGLSVVYSSKVGFLADLSTRSRSDDLSRAATCAIPSA
ncbi:hypothetical protein GCM10028793_00410 [Nocardiopsis oceani]